MTTSIPASLSARLETHGQMHTLAFWDRLDEAQREGLIQDLQSVDFEHLARLSEKARTETADPHSTIEPLPQVTRGADPAQDARARALGEQLLEDGKVCAFVVAGGQGTRLGHDGPKGTYPATPINGHPLFQVFAEKLLALSRRVGTPVPWYVMTSPANHDATKSFFEANAYFGLDPRDVRFFDQGTMPAVDTEGRLILDEPHRLFRNPDGHGGSLRALHTSGAVDEMRASGIEEIFYFQVDNPLVEICDPTFMGYHREARSEFSSKSVPKRDPHEKVGVLCARDGQPGVIEYSDLADDLRDARDPGGKLRFRAGNIAVHAISRGFVERLNEGSFGLPFHVARKEIPTVDAGGQPTKVDGIKFETFVFDGLPLANEILVMEVPRADEFSPIKNQEGQDSAESSRIDQIDQFARWLEAAGGHVPRGEDGSPLHAIEISPLFADGADAVAARRADLPEAVTADIILS